jgi:hypothetical protein
MPSQLQWELDRVWRRISPGQKPFARADLRDVVGIRNTGDADMEAPLFVIGNSDAVPMRLTTKTLFTGRWLQLGE